MNKRLRKKKHLGEFRESGFHIEVRYEPGYFESHETECFDRFLGEFENHGFETGGGWSNDTYDGYVSVRNSRVAIDVQKPNLLKKLRQLSGVAAVNAGENVDSWYGPFED